ncbi:MAG: hypothetical protein LQ343_006596 [Gyalolechia ehrenbergii]|nr:MAG: hypothetical protein LQ343_006596 [Gyalolechia ehrenbergii]
MSTIRTSRKLLKNPNDLAEAVEHLRPRGSYDPLPPPGGYPLPAYIRRKFSFAPQLPNVSLISLLPDFASSSLDLGIDLDDSDSKRVSHETPTSIYVRYSLLSLREAASKQRLVPTPKPSLPKLDTTVPTIIESRKLRKPDNPVYVTLSDAPQPQPFRTLRRSHGLESLHRPTAPSSAGDPRSTSTTPTSLTEDSTPTTPRTLVEISDEEDYTNTDTLVPDGPDVASLCPRFDEVESRLLKRMARGVPNLFGSFFVVDFQLPGNPIRITSHDLLPVDLAPDEALFLDEANMDIPNKLKKSSNGKETVWTLPFEGELVDCRDTLTPPSHRFFGQIDLTDFLGPILDDDADIWLEIAYEEMEKAGIERRRKPVGHTSPKAVHAEAERVPAVIRALHRDYLVIGVSDLQKPGFGITMVSPTLATSTEIHDPIFLDWASLEVHLSTPQRFITRVHWQTPGRKDKLYCVPMFGPRLACWLCFLVDNELPEIWPNTEILKH